MLAVTNENFGEEVLNCDEPVLLEFYSDTCIPCKRMAPILSELESEHTDVKFRKLNINFGADIAQKYKVMSSPTIILFSKGTESGRIRGVAAKSDIEALIEEAEAE